jgi:hypothetical protein
MSVELRPATIADASMVAAVILSSRKAFVPFAPLRRTDAEVGRWVLEILIPSGGVTVACDGAGSANEEGCSDVLYELGDPPRAGGPA